MAIVAPVVGNRVNQAALPGARVQSSASAADFGGTQAAEMIQMGKGIEGAGRDITRTATVMQEREDADMIFRAEAALKEKQLEFDRQVNERKGAQAWGAAEEAAKFWNDTSAEVGATLKTDRQRRLFEQTTLKLRTPHLDTIARYEAGQRRASVEESANASIVSSIDLAAANAGNTEILGIARDDITRRTQTVAKLNGWPPERAEVELTKNLTMLHKQVIQAQIDKDPRAAREYYELNKEQIAGSERDGLEKTLNEGNVRLTAQEAGDKVIADGMSETEALAWVRQNYEGEEESAAVTEIKTRFSEVDGALKAQQKAVSDQAWEIVANGGGRGQIPAGVWAQLDAKEKIQINDHLRTRAERAKNGDVKTDIASLYDLNKMAVNDPEGFAQMNLLASPEFNKLSRGDQEQMIKLQATVAKGGPAVKELQTVDGQISAAVAPLKLDKVEAAIAENRIRAAIDAEAQARGKALDAAERQKVVDRMLIEGEVVNGRWYRNDPDRRMFEVYGTEDAAKFVPQIPRDERRKIVEALERAGRKATDAEIARLYKLKEGL